MGKKDENMQHIRCLPAIYTKPLKLSIKIYFTNTYYTITINIHLL
jgi:hypothetical protein